MQSIAKTGGYEMNKKNFGGRKRTGAFVASLAVAGLLATACSSSDGGDAASGDTTAPASALEAGNGEPIRIGVSLPLTGGMSVPGANFEMD